MPEAQSAIKVVRSSGDIFCVALSSLVLMMPAGNIVRLRNATRGTGRVRCIVRVWPLASIDLMKS